MLFESGDAFFDDAGSTVGQRPNCKLRTVRNPELAKDPIQVFLDGAFGEVQLVRNFLIQLGFAHEIHDLLFPEAEVRVKRRLSLLLRPSAC